MPRSRSRTEPCIRPLGEQYREPRKSLRAGAHPRRDIGRLDLLPDDALDRYREAFPAEAHAALARHAGLAAALEREVSVEGICTAMERLFPARPVLAVAVCLRCGAYEVVREARSWRIDRAMRRTGLSERELLARSAVAREL